MFKDIKSKGGLLSTLLRILSFVPSANWAALIILGIVRKRIISLLFGVVYGVLTFAVPSISTYVWIIGIVHFDFAYRRSGGASAKKKKAKKPAASGGNPSAAQSVRPAENSRDKFFRDMEKYTEKEGAESPFVPFAEYWPTYSGMDRRQKSWYFYWRSQVRGGVYPETDLSYIILHTYELLSGCGWDEAAEGYDMLIDLWMAYRDSFPQLDDYLFDWSADFALLHNLEPFYPDVPNLRPPKQEAVRDMLIAKHTEDRPLKLPFSLIDSLCDYSIVGSKFYKEGHQLLMQEAIPRVVALADAALLKQNGKGILSVYGPAKKVKQSWRVYKSALCPDADRLVEASMKPYSSDEKLRACINELVRCGENTLRELFGSRGRLRGVELDEDTACLIGDFLTREYAPEVQSPAQPEEKRRVSLDFDSIDALREQSDAVRDALEVPEAVSEKPPLTELSEVSSLLEKLPSGAMDLLNTLRQRGWEAELLPNAGALEELNRLSAQFLACSLVVNERGRLIVEDDFRDELDYIAENTPGAFIAAAEDEEDSAVSEDERFALEKLSPELRELVSGLTPEQRDVLYAVLSLDEPEPEIGRIAENALTMPELLIDGINDAAVELLGDILIDSYDGHFEILEQYGEELRQSIYRRK